MNRIELGTKVVFIGREEVTSVRASSMIEHVEEVITGD